MRAAFRWTSIALLAAVLGAGLCAPWIAPHGYAGQDRESPNVAPSATMARDLPLLVILAMVASVVVLIGNAAADVSAEALRSDT